MSDKSWAIAFAGSQVLLRQASGGLRLPTHDELHRDVGSRRLEAAAVPTQISRSGGRSLFTFALADDFAAPDGYRLEGLRDAYHGLSREEFRAAGTARQKVVWHSTHRFCSRCGAVNELHEHHEAMACPACGQLHFARVAPAVIVLVQRGREALLGRSPRFREGVYSTLAGFVEPGETLEECVHREILEEVGVLVTNLRYFGSQPHPFPNSLMIGFTADWLSGEIRADPTEIEAARWFTRDDLPDLPHEMSIARALIEDFRARTAE